MTRIKIYLKRYVHILVVLIYFSCSEEDIKLVCRLSTTKLSNGLTYGYLYNSSNQLSTVTITELDKIIIIYTFEYDQQGNLIKFYQDGQGNITYSYSYNKNNNAININLEVTQLDGSVTVDKDSIEYNIYGQPIALHLKYGSIISIEYDQHHNATKLFFKASTQDSNHLWVQLTYDNAPKIIGTPKALQLFYFNAILGLTTFSKNNIVNATYFSENGNAYKTDSVSYDYGQNGYPLKETLRAFKVVTPTQVELSYSQITEYTYDCN